MVSAVIVYGNSGPYGDGFRRISNPDTGESELVYEDGAVQGVAVQGVIDEATTRVTEVRLDSDSSGKFDTWAYMDGLVIVRIELDPDEDGDIDRWEYYDDRQKLEKVGFSLPDDGLPNAWMHHGPDGRLIMIEVSSRADRIVNRWEYYENGVMVRVEEDTNMDTVVDRWSTYMNGILTGVERDEDGDGRPDQGSGSP